MTILCIIFFLSGTAALIFESLWFQLLGLSLGNSVWASSIVLSAFMGGLALGNSLAIFFGHKMKSPVRLYAIVETIIGVSGLFIVLVFPRLTEAFLPIFRLFLDHAVILNATRTIISFLFLLVPATAMGATLPILVKALYKKDPNFGRVIGILYGWNTLGAVFGVLANELFLVKWFGIGGAGVVAAGFNIAAAAAITLSSKKFRPEDPVVAESPFAKSMLSVKVLRLLFASFLTGFILLALEVIWFRFAILHFNATSLSFSIMLAMVLFGIGLGGLFASAWFKRRTMAHRFLFNILILNGILIVLIYSNSSFLLILIEKMDDLVRLSLFSFFLIFPVSFISGIIFTMFGKAIHAETTGETKATGLLALANTTGGMFGSLLSGFIFIPFMGIEYSFFLLAVAYAIAAFAVIEMKRFLGSREEAVFHGSFAAVFFVSLCLFPFGLMKSFHLDRPVASWLSKGEKRVAVREGLTETIQYLQKDLFGKPYSYRLVTNDHSMSGTSLYAKRYMKLFAYWPLAVHSSPKSALLICYGCGSTAKALTDAKCLENIEIVDISRDVLDMSSVVFPDPLKNPLNDPRVRIHIEDGRFYLLTTDKEFDIITGEPPPPKYNRVVNLYSREYFQLIYGRLAEGGITTYWLPVNQLSVSDAKSILKAFSDVFDQCSLWTAGDRQWMMAGVKNPKESNINENFGSLWNDPVIGPEMRSLGFASAEQFGSNFIADGPRLRAWTSGSLPLTDNYPHRLSRRSCNTVVSDAHAFNDFKDSEDSRRNFMASKDVGKIWPEALRKEAEKHFSVRQSIISMLALHRFQKLPLVKELHQCIDNPLLADYTLWAFGSDQYVQDIIDQVLRPSSGKPLEGIETMELNLHLAAREAALGKYLESENYLRLVTERMGLQDINVSILEIRMYLLYLAGEKNRALEVKEKYINCGKEGREERGKSMADYWSWLTKTVAK